MSDFLNLLGALGESTSGAVAGGCIFMLPLLDHLLGQLQYVVEFPDSLTSAFPDFTLDHADRRMPPFPAEFWSVVFVVDIPGQSPGVMQLEVQLDN